MADPTPAGDPATGDPANNPAGDPATGDPANPTNPATPNPDDDLVKDPAKLLETHRKVRDEARDAKKRADAAEAELAKLNREKMTDQERRDADLKEAQDRADKAEAAVVRAEVAEAKKVPMSILPATGSKAEMEAAADAALAWRGDPVDPSKPKRPAPDPHQGGGGNPNGTENAADEFANFLGGAMGSTIVRP